MTCAKTIWPLCVLALLRTSTAAAQVYLPPGADLTVHPGDTVAIFGNVLNSGRWGTLNGAAINFYGTEWQNGAGGQMPDEAYYGLDTTQGAGGIFRFIQSSPQYVTGAYNEATGQGPGFPGISIANTEGLILEPGSDVKIRHSLNFETGYVFLNGNNLNMSHGSTITGYSDRQFVVTGLEPNGGSLYRESLTQNDNLVVFPVGAYPGSYSPLALQSHTAYPMTFHARVFDSVYSNATSGTTNPETVVLKTWNVGQPGLNIGDVSVWLQHDIGDEGRFFPLHRDSSYISLFTGNDWDTTGPKGVLNPGTLTTGAQLPSTFANLRDFTSVLLANAYLSVAEQTPADAQLEFQAYRQTIRLVRTFWITQYERSVAHYELQRRRADEDSFYTVAVVPTQTANGTSTTPVRYDQEDDDYYGDVTYYRVKIVGQDGHTGYSVVRLVPPFVAIVCSPDPAVGFFTVNTFGFNRVLRMELYDRAGQRVGQYEVNGTATISVPWLPAGMYVLAFYDQNRLVSTQKIILLRK
ncbi:T9SS type A sorting domain-containing protein [Dinghuibacter silviterrae]|uniref:Putative secreted protein (Por secretion system target) n=1 Tax=Dinghuibacter silviterrae TaxID=1539049 RepID=A0A4R8DTS7_9BACT|nr:T9SS type A sorting domain-containing protein [Dinghuibacter silviterrae]TDX01720.1 putative secreted protein (Por secretion system target) [Dinghuibacter silviterrae]